LPLQTLYNNFKKALKKEIPSRVREAKMDHDLGRIPASKEYKTRLQERKPEDSEEMKWSEDAGQYSERIWQWWKAHTHNFPALH
jgi:hypothetical protein